MCGRATLTTPGDELREQLGLDVVPTMVPRFNIAPSQPLPIIKTPGVLSFAAFGLSSFTNRPGRTVNLRAESLPNLPAYRDAFARRRCLVVVDGFFEWRDVHAEPSQARLFGDDAKHSKRKAAKQEKQAFHIRRADRAPFTLAGVWTEKPGADSANDVVECAIVTGAAAGVVSELHDRMPAIVAAAARGVWLSAADGAPERDALRRLLSRDAIAAGAADLVAIPVGPRVNSPAFDDEEVLTPAADPRRL